MKGDQKGMKSESSENEFSEYDSKQPDKIKETSPQQKKANSQQTQKTQIARNNPLFITTSNVFQRTLWTFILLLIFALIIFAGNFYIHLFILGCVIQMFHEIISLKRYREKDLQLPFSSLINWYFFSVGIFFFHGKLFSAKLTTFIIRYEFIQLIVQYHNFISFLLWIAGFLMFVLSLKRGFYRYQFRQFGWTHLIILLIVAQSAAIILNMYEGLIWFILPCLLIISNDTFAYIFGKLFGRTKLIDISPNKTWEGFIGGFISTVCIGLLITHYLGDVEQLICPSHDLVFLPIQKACQKPEVFVQQEFELPSQLQLFGFTSIYCSKFQLHSISFALFASLISPFGGFFASGFKRALKIKDFGEMIPGHGGITDRMDCQIFMGMFSYLYIHQVILSQYDKSNILQYIAALASSDQLLIYNELKEILIQKNVFNSTNVY